MNKHITITDAAAYLEKGDNFLILTHIRPDGDTIGSACALAQGLRELGKKAYMLQNPELTARYAYYAEEYDAPGSYCPEHIIAVDTATTELLPANAAQYLDRISLCIDHHGTNTGYALQTCCYPNSAACGEIVYEILSLMLDKAGLEMGKKSADCLYVAISTDTGCFAYGNTTASSHRAAAQLIEKGAAFKEINKLLFRTKRRARITIEGLIASGIEYFCNGKVAIAVITKEMMDASGACEDDIDDISNIAISIEGVCIGVTIREMISTAKCKISVRTIPPFDASTICAEFGGGGHKAAAGASISKTADEIKSDLLEVISRIDFTASGV